MAVQGPPEGNGEEAIQQRLVPRIHPTSQLSRSCQAHRPPITARVNPPQTRGNGRQNDQLVVNDYREKTVGDGQPGV